MITALLIAVSLHADPTPKADTAQTVDFIKVIEDERQRMDLNDYEAVKEYRHGKIKNLHEGGLTPTFYVGPYCRFDWC